MVHVITGQTTPEDDYHWYLFKNQYDGNVMTIDICQSQYYVKDTSWQSGYVCDGLAITSAIDSVSLSIGIYLIRY